MVRDLACPPVCVGCGKMVDDSPLRHLCGRCCCRVQCIEQPCCRCCGHPFYGEIEEGDSCEHCEGMQTAFQRGMAMVVARGPARAMIHELKYHRGTQVIEDVETIARTFPRIMDHLAGATLVPVPLHPRKERERGFNQSLLVAQAFARAAGRHTRVESLLQRLVDTPSQTTFDRIARRSNLKNAFALLDGASIKNHLHYILIDDVFTTGSTLNSCAGVLAQAGCVNLDVVTFGHG